MPVLNSLNISPKKRSKPLSPPNSRKHYVPISRAVTIYFTGVLHKKKIALKTHLALKTYFPVSCKCFANAHPPSPSPPKSSRSHSSSSERHFVFLSILSWKCVHVASARTKNPVAFCGVETPAKVGFQKRLGVWKPVRLSLLKRLRAWF